MAAVSALPICAASLRRERVPGRGGALLARAVAARLEEFRGQVGDATAVLFAECEQFMDLAFKCRDPVASSSQAAALAAT